MKKLSLLSVLMLFVMFILWNSCKKDSNKKSDEIFESTDTVKVFGLQEIPQSELAAMAIASAPPISVANLDAKVDLKMPSIGYQGTEGSCVAWACAYATMSYHFFQPNYADASGTNLDMNKICSPEYVYNQIKLGDCDKGSYFTDYNGQKGALNLLQEQGVCIWSQMPYSYTNGCSTQPTTAHKTNATKYKLERFERIVDLSNINQLKAYLFQGKPIIIGARLDEGFMNAGKSFIWKSANGKYKGNHAMVVCGYDDSKNAFKLMNSWAKSWGDNGYK